MATSLATIQIIKGIQPIPNADAIEVASVLGWKVVVKKNEFKPNDLCVYIPIDTVVPDTPGFNFLQKSNFRIRTVKMRGQLSQGIVFSVSILPPGNYSPGQDVNQFIGVKKYEKPVPFDMADEIFRAFPSCVPMTDEIRIQDVPEAIDELKGQKVYITVKLDGTSASFIRFGDETHICSRKISLKENKDSIYWKMYHKYNMKEMFEKYPDTAIQGELCGPGIQKNRLRLKDHDLFVFNIYDIREGKYYDFERMQNFCKTHNLRTVPVERSFVDFQWTMDELLEMAKGKYENTGNNREGIVIRPVIEMQSKAMAGRLSFKVLNNDYLLKDEE